MDERIQSDCPMDRKRRILRGARCVCVIFRSIQLINAAAFDLQMLRGTAKKNIAKWKSAA